MHYIQFMLILSLSQVRFDPIFLLIKANEALSLLEETSPEETDKTSLVLGWVVRLEPNRGQLHWIVFFNKISFYQVVSNKIFIKRTAQ